ncbi:MAG: peptidoglycan recognition family protein [Planctomycetota bacterium]
MPDSTRRRFLISSVATGAALTLAGCASSRSSRRVAPPPSLPSRTHTGATASTIPPRTTNGGFVSHRPDWLDDYLEGTATPAVGVISRSEWAKFGPNRSLANLMTKITRLTIHHDGMQPFTSKSRSAAASRLESIRRSHAGSGWADIGYHYVIDPAGRIWHARPESLQGAHVKSHNAGNIGIMVMGNYERQTPTRESVQALRAIVTDRMAAHRISKSRIHTHRELGSTACPGRSLQAAINDMRSSLA